MPTIILMRHANAELASPGMRDFDRPLSMQGKKEAKTTSGLLKIQYLNKFNIHIDAVFCSPACRTIETLQCLREDIKFNDSAISYPHDLYAGGEAAYSDLVHSIETNKICLVIGHNPMIENFTFSTAQNGNQAELQKLKFGFPTAAIAVIDAANQISGGNLQHFFTAD